MKNTFVFTVGSIVCKLFLGLVIALILNEAIAAARAVALDCPAPVRDADAGLGARLEVDVQRCWRVSSTTSLQKSTIRETPTLWLADPSKAMRSVIAVNVWRGFPFFVITILAGLQAVPQELYDAAKVDGAGVWSRFVKVTLPGITASDRRRDALLDDSHLQ